MLNLVFAKDMECWVRYGGADGKDCTLVDFCKRMCANYGECVYDSGFPAEESTNLDVIGDVFADCSGEGCPVGTAYFAMIQAAELRGRLKMYEDNAESSTLNSDK